MAETGTRDSGRFRDDLGKLWADMYYGNGKPGITTRIQILEDGMERMEEVAKALNENVTHLTTALHQFQGGKYAVQGGMSIFEKVLTIGIAVLAGLVGHFWK